VSYSFYLWHAPVINFARGHDFTFDSNSAMGFAANWLLVFSATLALAVATYIAVERPFLRMRARAKLQKEIRT
jgi:peptidoglycan/LPS O-acetylase OafA/YrhL